ncbi:substrate-specific activator of APC-dependent proteolysis [Coemansia sp. Benny D115]|nr:substrate-specific activator of APC-dependent proteolysis [Coemansia sp. Benny D115]
MWDADFGRRLRTSPQDDWEDDRRVDRRNTARSKSAHASTAPRAKARSSSRVASRSPTRAPRPRDSVDGYAGAAEGIVTRSMARRLRAEKKKESEMPPPAEKEDVPLEKEEVWPVRRMPQFNYDRFIPTHASADLRALDHSPRLVPSHARAERIEHGALVDEANRTYDALLRAELLNARAAVDDFGSPRRARPGSPAGGTRARRDLLRLSSSPRPVHAPPSPVPALVPWSGGPSSSSGSSSSAAGGNISRPTTPPMLAFRSPRKAPLLGAQPAPNARMFMPASPAHGVYQTTPICSEARRLLQPRSPPRRISRDAAKVLDAPGIVDDYYLSLMDWSSSNRVAVALGSEVFVWDARTSATTRLLHASGDTVTSVRWAPCGRQLAVGLNSGAMQLWDTARAQQIRTLGGHARRVGVLDWRGDVLSSGSRDRRILSHDVRAPGGNSVTTFSAHRQEVCGLRWSPDGSQLASGGNDNLLLVWDARYTPVSAGRSFRRPLHRLSAHTAAVKALAWSPTQPYLLASGGGTDDRCIRMWNTATGAQLSSHDTRSQVCGLAWSPDGAELVSTHGYSQNHVVVWGYPQMTPLALLAGHTKRVLYLAQSPDGRTIATAAGDETIRFWEVFDKPAAQPRPAATAVSSAFAALPVVATLDDLAHVRPVVEVSADVGGAGGTELPVHLEKTVMGSTAVANFGLVQRLLTEHRGNAGYVIELLIRWMDEDPDNTTWYLEDGPVDYNGPTIPSKENSISVEEKPTIDDDEAKDKVDDEPTATNVPTKPVRGAARKKKAESKKQQKELAKMKKRKAAREFHNNMQNNQNDTQSVENELAQSINHIYI